MSNSPLVVYTKLSPNYSARTAKVDRITIHHMACNISIEACGAGFANPERKASSNYGIGTDGRVGLYVDEKNRAWTSSNWQNDNRAVTLEVANDGGAPDWHVSDAALEATIALCVDICRRNGIARLNYTGDTNGNLTMHKWFAATQCPGPYLGGKFPYIAEEVNRRLGAAAPEPEQPKEEPKPEAPKPTGTIYRVQVGAFSKKAYAEKKRQAVEAAGFDAYLACADSTLWRVQVGACTVKADAEKLQLQLRAAGFSGYVTAISGKTEAATEKAPPAATSSVPYLVQVSITNLKIRKGPGTDYDIKRTIKPGVYTIVEESSGTGSTKGWGKLKSGEGWIALDYAAKLS